APDDVPDEDAPASDGRCEPHPDVSKTEVTAATPRAVRFLVAVLRRMAMLIASVKSARPAPVAAWCIDRLERPPTPRRGRPANALEPWVTRTIRRGQRGRGGRWPRRSCRRSVRVASAPGCLSE